MSTSRLNWSCSCGRYSWSKPRRSAGFTFCTSDRLDRDRFWTGGNVWAVSLPHVCFNNCLELLGDALALERDGLGSVDVDRRDRHFAGARQADADVGVLGLTRAVDDAAHHRHAHLLDTRVGA